MSKKRRGKGEGSIFPVKDRKDLWAAKVSVGNSDGRRIRKTIYGKTKREVTEKLTRLQNQALDGIPIHREKLTVAALIDRWLTSWAKNLAPGTVNNYRRICDAYVIPNLGTIEVAKLLPLHVRALLDKLATDGVGDRTRQYVYVSIHRMMTIAVRLEIAFRNPCAAVDPPKVSRREVEPPQGEQLGSLRNAAAGGRWEALVVLALTSGMRQGELFALAWENVDLDRGVIFVRHSLEDLNGKLRLKEPKSKTSRRTIGIGPETVAVLRSHRRLMESEGHGSQFVFCDSRGDLIRKSNFHRNVWKGLRKTAGMDSLRFHDLRHASGSALIEAGVDAATVRDRLGHSTMAMTDRYLHSLTAPQRSAASTIESGLKIFCRPFVDLNPEKHEKKDIA